MNFKPCVRFVLSVGSKNKIMRVTNILKENSKGLMTIETLTDRGFLGINLKPIKRTFIANREFPKGYWNWVEMPYKTLVGDSLSFQLDEWLKFDI